MALQEDGKEVWWQLIQPINRISSASPSNPDYISLSNENINRVLAEALTSNPEYESVPSGIISVVGSDENNFRKVYTDWLIHYFRNRQDRNAIREWKICWSAANYIGSSTLLPSQQENGIYVWRKPFPFGKVKSSGKPTMLLWIIYANNCDSSGALDALCASCCSTIVTFQKSESANLSEFIYIINQDGVRSDPRFTELLEPCQLRSTWSIGDMVKCWDELVNTIEKQPQQALKFQGKHLTLRNFAPFLAAMQKRVNDSLGTATTPVQTLQSPNEHVPSPDIHISERINTWIQNQMHITNIDQMLHEIRTENGVIPEVVLKLHQILKSFNMDLKNMYDNYVCFHGDRDMDQMQKFQELAYQRAKQVWERNSLHSNGFSVNILYQARTKLCGLYDEHNQKIVERERKLVQKVVDRIEKEYTNRLKRHVKTPTRKSFSDFQSVHDRMLPQCIATMGRSLNYDGKLNNIVREATEKLQVSLNDIFRKVVMSATFLSEHTLDEGEADRHYRIEKYDRELKKLTALQNEYDPDQLRRDHDAIIQYVTKGMDELGGNELAGLLYAHFLQAIENLENKSALNAEQFPAQICIYLSMTWAWVVAYTRNMGSRAIQFGSRGDVDGFPAVCARAENRGSLRLKMGKGKFLWGHSAKSVIEKKGDRLESYGDVFNFVRCSDIRTGLEMTRDFFKGVKATVERCMNGKLAEVTLIIPGGFTFSDRSFLRRSCWAAGFRKVVILGESSISAFQVFSRGVASGNENSDEQSLVLVVNAGEDKITMEIYSGGVEGVQLLAFKSERWPSHENERTISIKANDLMKTIKSTYERTVNQLLMSKRNLVRYYIPITDHPFMKNALDEQFRDKRKMKKWESVNGDTLLGIFSQCLSDSQKLGRFLEILAKTPESGIVNRNSEPRQWELNADEGKLDEDTLRWKRELLEKCDKMEKQMDAGSIVVGRLTAKIIREAIRRGRLAASVHTVKGDEAKEIDELFKLHHFR